MAADRDSGAWGRLRRLSRGLQFRLTVGYAIFFTLMLIVVGQIFRSALKARLEDSLREVVDEEWAAMKGFLRIEDGRVQWFYDRADADELAIIARMRRVLLVADGAGRFLEASDLAVSMSIEPKEAIIERIRGARQPHTAPAAWKIVRTPGGQQFLIRSGILLSADARHEPHFVALGRNMADNERAVEEFTYLFLFAMPFVILTGCAMGWWLSNRALQPVMEVARAAERISGSNLSLRLPERGAGDQLDTLTATFNQMIARLETSFTQVRQFSDNVSHELRTPLTAVRGQLEVALFTARTADQYRDAIADTLEDIERLSQIIRKLLSLAQAETGQVSLQRTQCDLRELSAAVIEQFELSAEEAAVTVTLERSGPCIASVDRVQFERLLSNLISNALKFTPRGGKVSVGMARAADSVTLTVSDTGRGIAPEHLPHVFDRFYRAPDERAPDEPGGPERGLGLGLSFVHWIVKAHGGTIHVDSTVGRGTRFDITLPAGPADRRTGPVTADAGLPVGRSE